jgi:hypothetical protein
MPKKLTIKDFIERSKEKHGDKYDYSLVEYKNSKHRVKIICKKHSVFLQSPSTHMSGGDCRKCIGYIPLEKDEFIRLSRIVHGDIYDYSLYKYINNKTNVDIICHKHGIFNQNPQYHTKGGNCPKCCTTYKRTTDSFINQSKFIHGEKYIYNKTIYINSSTKVIVTCRIHGDFKIIPSNHLIYDCTLCVNNNILKTLEQFIIDAEKVHGNIYDYSKVVYKSNKKHIIIICKEHKFEFLIRPDGHLSGRRCPKCTKTYWKSENRWLDDMGILQENRQYRIGRYKVDGFDPITNTIYEYMGDFFHGNPDKYKLNDINPKTHTTYGELNEKTIKRETYLKSLGYNLISIWHSEYKAGNK